MSLEKEEQLRRANKDSLHSEETVDIEIRTLLILATDKLDISQASLHDELKKKIYIDMLQSDQKERDVNLDIL